MCRPALEQTWRASWRPPERYTPSEWAERNFILPTNGNAEPGRFRFARTPYLRGIVDAFVEPGIEDVIFIKPTRVGGTTAGQIVLGYWIDNDPGPCLSVMPSEAAAEQEIKERVRPMLASCPSLKTHVSANPHDNTLAIVKLDTMTLYFGWAGSPQSLASNTCRYARFDEVDKYPPFAGREADPISLGKERTATYLHRKRHYITSTPTTRNGAIWKSWESCGDKRHFHVPCPHCGKYQRLVWPRVKWPKLQIPDKIKLADEIEQSRLAWYECERCQGRIEESHKPKMLERGDWASVGQSIGDDGTVTGERPRSRRVGFTISSLYSPWRKFWEIAAQFIRAAGDAGATMNFYNSALAEPFEIQVSKTEASVIRGKAEKGPKPKLVPAWARFLIATADTQKDHFYYVIRAWGFGNRSQLVDYGIVSTFDELRALTLNTTIPSESGVQVLPQLLLIDSGGGRNADTGATRTNEVYEFASSDPARIKPIKGSSRRLTWPIDKSLQRDKGLVLWNIDTFACKNTLNRLIHDPDESKWLPHSGVNDDYCSQMASEHLVVDPQTKEQEWKQKSSGAPNHYFDCEVYQCAAAFEIGAHEAEQPVAEEAAASQRESEQKPWVNGSGWQTKNW